MPLFDRLMEKYGDRDVEVLHLYVREPHPGERAFKQYKQPERFEERMAHAKELVEKKAMATSVLVDTMDDTFRTALGGLPNVVYVVGKNGKVHYKASWADADKIDCALAELVSADDPSRPVEPTFDTQGTGPQI